MARRKLYGAAKLAHQRKLARRKRRTRSRRRAKPRRRSRRRSNMPRRRRRRRRSNPNYGTKRLQIFGAGIAYGYLTRKVMKADTREKIPGQDAIGFDGVMAVILHYGAKHFRNKWLDMAATAAAGHCGVVFGQQGLDVDEAKAELSGGDELLGAIPAE